MRRREFLVGAVGLATAAQGCATSNAHLVRGAGCASTCSEVFLDWEEVRSQFDTSPDLVHLGAFFIASHPRPVREAIERHRRGLDENPVRYLFENNTRLRLEVLREASDYFGVGFEDIATTDSTTMGLGLLYNGLKLAPGDEIVHENEAYYSTVESLKYKADQSGATVREVQIFDDPATATAEQMADRLLAGLGPATRVVALTWVHSDTGVKLPIPAIAARIAELNQSRDPDARILLCVDGVHGFGIEDVNLSDLGCDFFAAGCHKWLFGPRGTGVLFAGRTPLWQRVRPTIPAFGVQTTPGLERTPGGFHSFEHRWALAEAFRFVSAIGKDRIAARTRELAGRLKSGLQEIRGVSLFTPTSPELSAGIVAFNVEGRGTAEVQNLLLDRGFVVARSTTGRPSVRAAPSIMNSPEQIDRLVREIGEL